jgi:hypothetical protein
MAEEKVVNGTEEIDEKKSDEKTPAQVAEGNKAAIAWYVEEGKLPTPRSLTRKERRALDDANLNLLKIPRNDPRSYTQVRDELADWVVENVFPDFDFDSLPNCVVLWFAQYVYGLTYKDDISEKN